MIWSLGLNPVSFFGTLIAFGIVMFWLYIQLEIRDRKRRIKEREERSAKGLS